MVLHIISIVNVLMTKCLNEITLDILGFTSALTVYILYGNACLRRERYVPASTIKVCEGGGEIFTPRPANPREGTPVPRTGLDVEEKRNICCRY